MTDPKTWPVRNRLVAVILMLGCMTGSARAQSTGGSDQVQKANELYQAQRWSEAAAAYEAIAAAQPSNGRAWFRLGVSLQKQKLYERAVDAYTRAYAVMPEQARPAAAYNLGAAYAMLKIVDQAFLWLDKAVAGGAATTEQLGTDPELEILRGDRVRFQTLVGVADKLTRPCMYNPEHRQFDFWLGEWDVTNAQGQRVGSSRIERIENGCIILENWDSGPGGSGKSLNFYDANLRKWRQTWVDSTGGVSEFSGVFTGGALRFEGESHAAGGDKIWRKLTFFSMGPDRVRQFSEASTDGGKTWSTDYDYNYTRRK